MNPDEVPIPERQKLLDKFSARELVKAETVFEDLDKLWPDYDLNTKLAMYHYATGIYTKLISEFGGNDMYIVSYFSNLVLTIITNLAHHCCAEEYEKSLAPDVDELKRIMEL
jgi:hypothetical protein